MDQTVLETWLRKRDTATTDEIRKTLRLARPGGSTWIQIARVLVYHGFERSVSGWVRVSPSPKTPCPSYRELQKAASDRRARCKAALAKEQGKDLTLYEPTHRDPRVQDPTWAQRGPKR